MKARLIFDLSDREDAMAHRRCIHSAAMAQVLFELVHNGHTCRNFSELYSKIIDECEKHGIVIDDLIE